MAEKVGQTVVLGLRPEHFVEEDLRLGDQAEGTRFTARATVAEPTGADILLRLPLGSGEVTARVSPKVQVASGQRIALRVDMGRAVLFAPESEQRLA